LEAGSNAVLLRCEGPCSDPNPHWCTKVANKNQAVICNFNWFCSVFSAIGCLALTSSLCFSVLRAVQQHNAHFFLTSIKNCKGVFLRVVLAPAQSSSNQLTFDVDRGAAASSEHRVVACIKPVTQEGCDHMYDIRV
jgi:hypothetical protein